MDFLDSGEIIPLKNISSIFSESLAFQKTFLSDKRYAVPAVFFFGGFRMFSGTKKLYGSVSVTLSAERGTQERSFSFPSENRGAF